MLFFHNGGGKTFIFDDLNQFNIIYAILDTLRNRAKGTLDV